MRNILFNVKIWGKVIEREDNLNLAQFSDKLFKIIIYYLPCIFTNGFTFKFFTREVDKLFLVYIYSEIDFLVHN